MKIIVYGTAGCSGCKAMFAKINAAMQKNNIAADLIYETDLRAALNKGIMSLPALEVDGVLKKVSHNPKEKELLDILLPQ